VLKRLLNSLTLCILLLIAATTVFAQQPRIEIVGLQFIGCGSGAVEGRFNVAVFSDTGFPLNDTSSIEITTTYTSDGVYAEFVNALRASDLVTFGIYNPGGTITFAILQAALTSDPGVKSPAYFLDCATGSITTMAAARDARLNYGAGDLLAALYMGTDSTGQPTIDVYQIVAPSKGSFIGGFEKALFTPYIDAPPAANTLLARIGQTSLYALTSGEFQINIGPDAEGKIARVLFRSFPPTNIRLFPAAR
jgi:hypothetical protein